MAKTLQAKVSKTSGQGISRLAYQQAYRMKGGLTSKFTGAGKPSTRDYAKGDAKPAVEKGINVSYGDTYEPGDLADIKTIGERTPLASQVKLGRTAAKKLKGN